MSDAPEAQRLAASQGSKPSPRGSRIGTHGGAATAAGTNLQALGSLRRLLARAPVPDLEALLHELPAVEGPWPDRDAEGPLVFVGCDSAYLLEHGLPFALSLDRNSPGTRLHVHLVNPDSVAEAMLGRIARALANTTLTRTAESFDFTGLSPEFARSYCASIRFVRLLQLLQAVRQGVLMLDIDMLVRGDLRLVTTAADGHDCAIHTRFQSRKKREKLFASVFYAAPTPATLTYLEDVATRIASMIVTRRARWYVDQCVLYDAYRAGRASGSGLRLRHLPLEYADWTFGKRSILWAGKGWRKRRDETYLAQRAAYIPKADRLAAPPSVLTLGSPRVAVLLPRLDLPFKNPGGLRGLPDRLRRRSPQDMGLRAHWRALAEAIVSACRRHGCEATLVVHPLWKMTTEFVERLEADLVFIPHKQRSHLGRLHCRTFFYMQMTFPWLFTVDPLGWSAGSSAYPCDYRAGEPESGTFERYVERVVRENGSKYSQPPSRARDELVARGEIPEGPYIFFACQRPNDQAIRFFSPYEVVDVVAGLARWARDRGVPVVFKAHPTNAASVRPVIEATDGLGAYWSTASVHDLIAYSEAVYVINSGVGFETMLHNKPVVTFGQVEYDAVSIHGDLGELDRVWQDVQGSEPHRRLASYRRFVDWYCRLYCVDLSDPQAAGARLAAVIAEGVGGKSRPQWEDREGSRISLGRGLSAHGRG